jgi:hypothetical protein
MLFKLRSNCSTMPQLTSDGQAGSYRLVRWMRTDSALVFRLDHFRATRRRIAHPHDTPALARSGRTSAYREGGRVGTIFALGTDPKTHYAQAEIISQPRTARKHLVLQRLFEPSPSRKAPSCSVPVESSRFPRIHRWRLHVSKVADVSRNNG